VAGILLAWQRGGDHLITGSLILAMAVDVVLYLWGALHLSATDARRCFELAVMARGRLMKRALLVFAISIVFLLFSMHGITEAKSSERSFHLFEYFLGVMLCWLELQLAFATYYAKCYYNGNPLSNQQADQGPQELIFPGVDDPVFSDFIYIASTVALTFATSDVNVESSNMRRVVVIQALASFFFYSMIFSVVTNLLMNS
jgi:uncharacterized membrane protein